MKLPPPIPTFALLTLIAAAIAAACTDEPRTIAALQASGFRDIDTTGHSSLCGNEAYCTGFEATGPTGRRVEGAVGCGCSGCGCKGCTIRIGP